MKSEPDRLDLLIVFLPLILLTVMGVQIFRFVQMSGDRQPGAELAAEVIGGTSTADPAPAGDGSPAAVPPGATAEAPSGEGAAPGEPAAGPDSPAAGEGATPAPGNAGEAPDAGTAVPGAAGPTGSTPTPPATPGALAPLTDEAGNTTPPNVVRSPDGGGSAATPGGSAAATPPAGSSRTNASPSASGGGGAPAGSVPVVLAPSSGPATDPPPAPPVDDAPSAGGSRGGGGGGGVVPDPPGGGSVDPRQPALVTAVPPAAEVFVGDVVEVEIRIDNASNVASVPFHLQFNPTVLTLLNDPPGERGPFLESAGVSTQFLVAPGRTGRSAVVGLSLMGASTGVSGSGRLLTIRFRAVKEGTTNLGFTNASVRGPDAATLRSTFVPAQFSVSP